MPTTLQIRRGTETECNAFTGASGELIYDTTNNFLFCSDTTTCHKKGAVNKKKSPNIIRCINLNFCTNAIL